MVDTGTPFTLNTTALHKHFVDASIAATDRAAGRALARAQKHVPVRKIFRGTTMTRTTSVSENRSPHVSRSRTTREDLSYQRPVERAVRMPGQLTEHDIRSGHPNSSVPVFTRGGFQLTGDFRSFSNVKTKEGRLRQVEAYSGKRGGDLESVGMRSGRKHLTVGGRYEVRSGRALYSPVVRIGGMSRALEVGGYRRGTAATIGGRLKGELRVEKATYAGGYVWAYVHSPTRDPVTGYPYGRAQEFGTVHHRQRPFLRPALHETRTDLSNYVARSVKAGPQK